MVATTTPELRLLHFTDYHEGYDGQREVLVKFLEKEQDQNRAINVIGFTGDAIEMTPYDNRKQRFMPGTGLNIEKKLKGNKEVSKSFEKIKEFLSRHDIKTDEDVQNLDYALKRELYEIFQDHQEVFKQTIIGSIKEGYDTVKEDFTAFSQYAPIVGIAGNHDTTHIYDSLDDLVSFADRQEKVVIKGNSGIEFSFKGDNNTCEVPRTFSQYQQILESHLINYALGEDLSSIDEQLEEAQRLDNKNAIEQLTAHKKYVESAQKQERERLGSADDVDIYLTHKTPHNDSIFNTQGSVTGEVTKEYAANANAVYGGHFHVTSPQIGLKTINDHLSELEHGYETRKVDDVEVPVLRFKEDEPFEFNPGTDYFTVTEFNAKKEVEKVIVYQYIFGEPEQKLAA